MQVATIKNKADITYVNDMIATKSSGTPLFASSTIEMTDTTKNYVNTSDGYIYTYNGASFIKTNVQYQGTEVSNKSITVEKLTRTVQPIIKSSCTIKTSKNGNAINLILNGNIYLYEKNFGTYTGYKNIANVSYDMPNYSNLVWNLTDNSISVIADGVTLQTYNYITLLTNVNGILYGELSNAMDLSKYEGGTIINSINNIKSTIEVNVTSNSDNSVTLKMGSGSFYLYSKDLAIVLKQYNPNSGTFTLKNWGYLIWDLENNIVKSVDDSISITLKHIVLGWCVRGVFISPYLIIKGDIPINTKLEQRVANLENNSEVFAVPEYWKSHIESKIEEINTILNNDGKDVFGFYMFGDSHVTANALKSGELIRYIESKTNIKNILALGDFVNEDTTSQGTINRIKIFFDSFKDKKRFFPCLGNHDTKILNSTELVPYNQLYNTMYSHLTNVEQPIDSDCQHYFFDDEKDKVRYIILNTNDMNSEKKYASIGFSEKQIKWLGNVALNFEDKKDEEWSVVISSHIALRSDELTRNSSKVIQIINAFKNKQSIQVTSSDVAYPITSVNFDFSNKKNANIVVWVSGHEHYDLVQDYNGIKQIWIVNDSYQQYSDGVHTTPTRTLGTITEHALDVVLVNRKTKRIDCIRIGAGDNRSTTF